MSLLLQLVTLVLVGWLVYRTAPKPATTKAAINVSAIVQRAIALTIDAEQVHQSGEAKRHQVYARLIKEYPGVSRRVLSRVIEDALDAWP